MANSGRGQIFDGEENLGAVDYALSAQPPDRIGRLSGNPAIAALYFRSGEKFTLRLSDGGEVFFYPINDQGDIRWWPK